MNGGQSRVMTPLTLWQQLAAGVDPLVAKHWDDKILSGILPTEIRQQGRIDPQEYEWRMEELAEFEANQVAAVMGGMVWHAPNKRCRQEVHYFGIGTGHGLRKVAEIVNTKSVDVVAYDTSWVGCGKGEIVFDALKKKRPRARNRFYYADVELACDPAFIKPGVASLLVAARVLDVLDNVSKDSQKMARTAIRMGALLRHLKILLIVPPLEGNEEAVFGDTRLYPHVFELLAHYMQLGLEEEVTFELLGAHRFYGHLYEAVLYQASTEVR